MPEAAVVNRATYVKRRRVSGWRAPDGAVSCTRQKHPTRWGNPYRVGDRLPTGEVVADHDQAVDLYRAWMRERPIEQAAARKHLAGKVLMCWCAPGLPCHVQDVLLPVVNGETPWT
jgi:hypothetical protein